MKSMRFALAAATLILLIEATSSAPETANENRPNIVLLVADDLGWNDVGFHGSEIRTPHLDRLAESGAQLDRFYVLPVCSPTRAALMTGRYPIRYGLQRGVVRPWALYGLPLEERTLPQGLKEAGYRTAMVGKWHLGQIERGYVPTRRGFDSHYGHYLGMLDYYTHDRMDGLDWHRDEEPSRDEGYTTSLIAEEAERIVVDHDFGDPDKPLFLYVPFNAPHTPLQAPDEWVEKYEAIPNKKRRVYAAMTSCMDDAIGRILGALKKKGAVENTLVLFFSDNGGPTKNGADNTPLRGAKGTLYEGGTRVAALASWPGVIPSGSKSDDLLHVTDVFPTLLGLAGVEGESALPLDGRNAGKLLLGEPFPPREELLLNVNSDRGAIRQGDFKLVAHWKKNNRAEKVELFDLGRDPNEKTNLAETNPDRAAALLERLKQLSREAVPEKGSPASLPTDFTVPDVWGEGQW